MDFTTQPDRPQILRQDLLDRLLWPVFEDISDIMVFPDPSQKGDGSAGQSFMEHPLAGEPVSDCGLREMLVNVAILADKAANSVEAAPGDEYAAPELRVTRGDGGIITIGDFVTQVHGFLQTSRDAVLESEQEIGDEPGEGLKHVYLGCITPTLEDLEDENVMAIFSVELGHWGSG